MMSLQYTVHTHRFYCLILVAELGLGFAASSHHSLFLYKTLSRRWRPRRRPFRRWRTKARRAERTRTEKIFRELPRGQRWFFFVLWWPPPTTSLSCSSWGWRSTLSRRAWRWPRRKMIYLPEIVSSKFASCPSSASSRTSQRLQRSPACSSVDIHEPKNKIDDFVSGKSPTCALIRCILSGFNGLFFVCCELAILRCLSPSSKGDKNSSSFNAFNWFFFHKLKTQKMAIPVFCYFLYLSHSFRQRWQVERPTVWPDWAVLKVLGPEIALK